MGWAGGSQIATRVYKSIQDKLDPLGRRYFAKSLIAIFEDSDCDTMDECEEIQKAAAWKAK